MSAPAAVQVAFRFGLTGRRWGEAGRVVLLLSGHGAEPDSFGALIGPLLAAGREVIALEDPSDASFDETARISEYAAAVNEAAVELRELEAVVGHGRGAAAAAQALTQGLSAERAVLIGSTEKVGAEDILESLLEREPLRRAA